MKNYLIVAGIAVLVSLAVGLFARPTIERIVQVPGLGAAGPYFATPDLSFGGVLQYGATQPFNNSSTTICSMVSPASTSTLLFGSAQATTGTTTALFIDVGQSTLMDATTTVLNSTVVPGGAQWTINATTTTGTGKLVFAPNTRLNVKYGGAALGSLNALGGGCKAIWVVD